MKIGAFGIALAAMPLSVAAFPMPAFAKQPSVFVQCDGNPAHMGDAEKAARIVALSAVVGLLLPGPEKADSSERLTGTAGVMACSAALQSESDAERRVELAVARAIHQIEAGSWPAAVADAQEAMQMARPMMADIYFAQSLGLSVMEVNAAALLKAGRYSEAEAMGFRMADAAPYDLVNQLRAWKYVGITTDRNDQLLRFFERLSKMFNGAIKDRAFQLEWQGRFLEANALYVALLSIYRNDGIPDGNNDLSGYWKARQAVALMMAGDRSKSDALIAEARVLNDRLASRGAIGVDTSVSLTDELIDFHAIQSLMADGKLADARQRFRQRARWLAPMTGAVAPVVDNMRLGAPPSDVDGPLARPGSEVRNEIIVKARLRQEENERLPSQLFSSIRPLVKASDFRQASRSVWNISKSRYLVEKKGELANVPYEIIVANDVYGHPAGYAALMHAALLARQRGKQGFIIIGDRKRVDTIGVLIGNAGDPGVPGEQLIEFGPIIEALQQYFPEPQKSN